MRVVCWVVPVDQENVPKLEAYTRELESARREDFVESERNIGIDREMWFLWQHEGRSYIVLFMQGSELSSAFRAFQHADGAFEIWSREMLSGISSHWPEPFWSDPGTPGVLRLLSAYDSTDPSVHA